MRLLTCAPGQVEDETALDGWEQADLGMLADAAEAADAPADYVAALRRRPCRSVGL